VAAERRRADATRWRVAGLWSAEPWAIAVTLLFAALIAVCIGFWSIAASHADEELALESVQRILDARTGSGNDDG
jgi:cytochrome c biogenesis factor